MNHGQKIKSFEDLNAWKEARSLVIMVYNSTRSFPKDEVFGLTNQIRRAAISITSNIAEGFSRQSYKDKIQFYGIALGSLTELQSQLITAKDISYLIKEEFAKLNNQSIVAHKLLSGLIKSSKLRNS
ncbi:MAG: four helix bundle protein [Patescibacteria group bacterium]|jgi:four helix bundle protein